MAETVGLILAGGRGTRLDPLTKAVNKHFLPVYDKPMIYYPLTSLMLAGIREIALVCNPGDQENFDRLLGDGSQWGINISYWKQNKPNGIAGAINAARDQIQGRKSLTILGDNIFFGAQFTSLLNRMVDQNQGATVLALPFPNPSDFGVIVFDSDNNPVELVEKPEVPLSNFVVPGIYAFDDTLLDRISNLQISARGEFEITDVNRMYLNEGKLRVLSPGRGLAWLDGGNPIELFEASQLIKVIEDRTGLKIACPEEIALRADWIDETQLQSLLASLSDNAYRSYVASLKKE